MAQKARKAVRVTKKAKPATRLVPAREHVVHGPLDAMAVRAAATREVLRIIAEPEPDARAQFILRNSSDLQKASGLLVPPEYWIGKQLLDGESWTAMLCALEISPSMLLGFLVRIASGQTSPTWRQSYSCGDVVGA